MTTAIKTTATISKNRQLLLDEDLPGNASTRVRVIVFIDDSDDVDEKEWLSYASENEAFKFLNEEKEDIYTSQDGEPLNNEI